MVDFTENLVSNRGEKGTHESFGQQRAYFRNFSKKSNLFLCKFELYHVCSVRIGIL